jgi:hypothetical protein
MRSEQARYKGFIGGIVFTTWLADIEIQIGQLRQQLAEL